MRVFQLLEYEVFALKALPPAEKVAVFTPCGFLQYLNCALRHLVIFVRFLEKLQLVFVIRTYQGTRLKLGYSQHPNLLHMCRENTSLTEIDVYFQLHKIFVSVKYFFLMYFFFLQHNCFVFRNNRKCWSQKCVLRTF